MFDRRRAMMKVEKRWHNLPSEYQEVQYITSTEQQYIDCNFYPTGNTTVDIDFSLPDSTSKGWIFGSRNNASTCNCGLFRENDTLPYPYTLQYRYDDNHPQLMSQTITNLENKINVRTTSGNFYINGVLIASTYGTTFTGSNTFVLFGFQYGAGMVDYAQRVTIYRCKVYNSLSIIRDFIPCYRKSDGKAGMYDLTGSICTLTNSPFYPSSISSEEDFMIGPNI